MSKSRGALLLFEGVDRSGKSSQSQALLKALRDHKVSAELMRFPDRTTSVGSMISSYLSGNLQVEAETIHLLFAANRFEKRANIDFWRKEMLHLLESGVTLILDRYAHSGAAFTMAKGINGLNKDWCQDIERGKLPSPDAIYYMHLPIDIVTQRSGFGEEKYETTEHQSAVKDAYEALMKNDDWTIIDANREPEIISQDILNHALTVVGDCSKGRPMQWLWSQFKS